MREPTYQELLDKVQKLQEQVNALSKELESFTAYQRGDLIFYHGNVIGNPQFYFNKYQDASKSDVILKLMKMEGKLWEHGLLHVDTQD
jgi:hypothetical protein